MHYISLINGMSNAQADDLMSFATDLLDGSSGIVGSGDYAVAQSSPVAMSVTVATGKAYVYISSLASYYRTLLDAAVTLSIAANSSGSTRIDAVCIKIDTGATPDADASNVATVVVVQGTPGAGAPATPANHYKLAEVTVASGAVSIANTAISDSRTQLNIRTGTKVGGQLVLPLANAAEVALAAEANKLTSPLTIVSLQSDFLLRQGFINGGCQVKQRPDATLSNTPQYVVDRMAVYAGGTVTGGNIGQQPAAGATSSSDAILLTSVSLTGSGSVSTRYRMEYKDAKKFKVAGSASFGVEIYHDVGSQCNAVITINKANATDNFGAVTNIATSGNLAVPSGVWTPVKFEGVTLGDCTNGLEIIVTLTTGAISNKTIGFTGFRMNERGSLLFFQAKSYAQELVDSSRYCQDLAGGTYADYMSYGIAFCRTTTTAQTLIKLPITMRAIPTLRALTPSDFALGYSNIPNVALTGLAIGNTGSSATAVMFDLTAASGLTADKPALLYAKLTGKPILLEAEL